MLFNKIMHLSHDEVSLVHTKLADSAEHTVDHQEVSVWDEDFTFKNASIKCTALTRISDATLTLDGIEGGRLLFVRDNIASATLKGGNLASKMLKKCEYLCISLKCDKYIKLTLWGSSKSGAFTLYGNGSVMGAGKDGSLKRFATINEEDSLYISIDSSFDGTLLIPVSRLADGGKDWARDAISSLSIKIKGGSGTVISSILSCPTALELSGSIDNPNYTYTSKQRLTPYWEGGRAYNEAMAMHLCDDGTVAGTLLFTPTRINAVLDVYLKKEYVEGVDWVWEKGTNRIIRPEGSSIPYFTEDFLSGKDQNGEYIPSYPEWTNGVSRFGSCIYCVSPLLYEKQIAVSYEYDPAEHTERPLFHASFKGDSLPKTMERLKNGSDLKVLFYGDSIFSGCDASSMYNREPFMPYMHKLIQEGLQSATSGTVTVDNIAVGGWSVQNGLDALKGALKDVNGNDIPGSDKSSCHQGYDLLIMSFGMNDMNVPDAKKVFTDYTTGIMDIIKQANPDLEVLLVSCMNPNPRVGWNVNQHNHASWFEQIAATEPYSSYTAVVDFYSAHSDILKYKSFASTTGNNINHPNDWLIRAYAQNILAALVK